jgi:hypothetical protein
MSDADQLRNRATRLLALALKARDNGLSEYADELTQLASEAFDQAADAWSPIRKLRCSSRRSNCSMRKNRRRPDCSLAGPACDAARCWFRPATDRSRHQSAVTSEIVWKKAQRRLAARFRR